MLDSTQEIMLAKLILEELKYQKRNYGVFTICDIIGRFEHNGNHTNLTKNLKYYLPKFYFKYGYQIKIGGTLRKDSFIWWETGTRYKNFDIRINALKTCYKI